MSVTQNPNSNSNHQPAQTASRSHANREVTDRFVRRMIELARKGTLGQSRTRVSTLQSQWAHWLGLLDSPQIPVMIAGERGTGKRRMVREYFVIQRFYNRLADFPEARFKVFRGDFVSPGFTHQWTDPHAQSGDLIYVEHIDRLAPVCQAELLQHLRIRHRFSEHGFQIPRLIMGTEKALAIEVLRGNFLRELYDALSGFSVQIPPLRDRHEDLPHIIKEMAEEMSSKKQNPPAWLSDLITRQLWDENFDQLQILLKNGLAKQSQLQHWTEDSLPISLRSNPPAQASFVRASEFIPKGKVNRDVLKMALLKAGGDRALAAKLVGLSRTELTQELMISGLR